MTLRLYLCFINVHKVLGKLNRCNFLEVIKDESIRFTKGASLSLCTKIAIINAKIKSTSSYAVAKHVTSDTSVREPLFSQEHSCILAVNYTER